MTEEEKMVLAWLPERLREAVLRTVDGQSGKNSGLAEISLRAGGPLCVVRTGRAQKPLHGHLRCTSEEIQALVRILCGYSLYAQAENMTEGVIVTDSGIRAGISGRAVVQGGRVTCVRDITSVHIRIPHRVPGAAEQEAGWVRSYGSLLLCSRPGMGKTTVLRELAVELGCGPDAEKTAVIDTRYELCAGLPRDGLFDLYPGWPREEGMTAAVRTMAPAYLLCDEIAGEGDVRAILAASAAGVTVAATAHGGSPESIRRNVHLRTLLEAGVFGCVCGLEERGAVLWAGGGQ